MITSINTYTFPVISSWCSKDDVVIVIGERCSQTLLTGTKPLVAPGTTFTEFPVSTIFIWQAINAEILTEYVAAPSNIPWLLWCVHKQTSLVPVSAGLSMKWRRQTYLYLISSNIQLTYLLFTIANGWNVIVLLWQWGLPQSFPLVPDSVQSPPSTDSLYSPHEDQLIT